MDIIILVCDIALILIFSYICFLISYNLCHYAHMSYEYILTHDLENFFYLVSGKISIHMDHLIEKYSTLLFISKEAVKDFFSISAISKETIKDFFSKSLINSYIFNDFNHKFWDVYCTGIAYLQGLIVVLILHWDRSTSFGLGTNDGKLVAIFWLTIGLLSIGICKISYLIWRGCNILYISSIEVAIYYDIDPIYLYILSFCYIIIILSNIFLIIYRVYSRKSTFPIFKIFSPQSWRWLEKYAEIYLWVWIISLIIKIIINLFFWTSGIPLLFGYNFNLDWNIFHIISGVDIKPLNPHGGFSCQINPDTDSSMSMIPESVIISLTKDIVLQADANPSKSLYGINYNGETLFIDSNVVKKVWEKNQRLSSPDLLRRYAEILKKAFPQLPDDTEVTTVQILPEPVSNKYDSAYFSNETNIIYSRHDENNDNPYNYNRFNAYRGMNDKQNHWFFTRLIWWICSVANSNTLVIHNNMVFNRETHDLIPLPSGNFIDTKLRELISISGWMNLLGYGNPQEVDIAQTLSSYPPMFLKDSQELDNQLKSLDKFGNTRENRLLELSKYPLIHELLWDVQYSLTYLDPIVKFGYIRDYYVLKAVELFDLANNKICIVVIVPTPAMAYGVIEGQFPRIVRLFDQEMSLTARVASITIIPPGYKDEIGDWTKMVTLRDLAMYLVAACKDNGQVSFPSTHDFDLAQKGIYGIIEFYEAEQQNHKFQFLYRKMLDTKIVEDGDAAAKSSYDAWKNNPFSKRIVFSNEMIQYIVNKYYTNPPSLTDNV